MNMDEKKIPESILPENSQLSSQEQLTDEDMEQVAGGARLSLLPPCPVCGEEKDNGVCLNPNCPTNQK